MPGQVSESGPDRHRGSTWSWLLPAGTFLAGLALGGVVVGVGAVGVDDGPSAPNAASAPDEDAAGDGTAGGDEGAGAGDTGLYVRVPDSCVRTAEDATTLVEQVDSVVAAVAELEPERLRKTIDDVQQIRDDVRDVAQQCRDAAAQRLEDVADAEAEAEAESESGSGDGATETPAS